jgi:type II secretory pathway pseudopilin PulG
MTQKNKKRSAILGQVEGSQAYTLLEVLFAVFILTTVLLGLAGMMPILIRTNSFSDLTDTAVNLAQDKLEELKSAFPASSVLADANNGNNGDLESTSNFDYQQSNIDGLGRPGGIYTRTWNIADNTPSAGMKTVVVIVSWNDPLGSHRVSFRTIL